MTVTYDGAGVPTIKLERANFLLTVCDKEFEPFVLSYFQVARPNPDTAILTYKAKGEAKPLAQPPYGLATWQGSYQVG